MSETKELEQQLRQSRESLDFALKSGRMGTWDIDLKEKTVVCSPEMLDLWGVNSSEFNGDRSILQSKVHPEDRDKMIEAIDEAIRTDTIYESEYRIFPKPQEVRWVMSRGRCSYDGDSHEPVRFSGVVFDITERKLKEEALTAALKARDHFFSIAGHELKTPLTCLHLQLKVSQWELRYNYPQAFTPEKIEIALQKQSEQLLRITRIIDNMLDESQISQGKLPLQFEKFDLVEMVGQVLDNFKVIAHSSGVDITFTRCQSEITGSWDRFRLEQVILNLLINAIRYGEKKPVHVEVSLEGQHTCITVKDQGMGINPEDQLRVFNRFERGVSSNDIRGLGLGLYISENIVRAHGGEIRLSSEPGVGSEFQVFLPLKY